VASIGDTRWTTPLPAAPTHQSIDKHHAEQVVLLGCCAHETAAAVQRLEEVGFRVEAASTAEELLRWPDTAPLPVIVVDADLPTENHSSIDRIVLRNATSRHIPVLVVCSNDRQVRRALDSGAADVIRRPVNWELAARRALVAIRSAESRRQLRMMGRMLDEATSRALFEMKRAERLDRVDQVTGLPNLREFEKLVERSLETCRRYGGHVAVLHLDINRFNEVNETFGLKGGDDVLRQVATRLEQHLAHSDIVRSQGAGLVTAALARGTGTRFHLVLGNIREPRDASRMAQSILESLSKPCAVGDSEIFLRGNVGISLAPSDGQDADTLLRFADMAMYAARRRAPGSVRFFNPSLNSTVERSMAINRLLRRAIDQNELFLHFQPLIQAKSGEVVGAEALLRWKNPDLGAVSPVEFIPVAEESGQMVEIGTWVLRQALRQLRSWLDGGMRPLQMNINVSRCQLLCGTFADTVRAMLDEVGVAPELVVFELSERGVLNQDTEILKEIRKLKRLGVRLAVDDFGIGDSAIAYLRGLEVDVLKIDQSYISGLAESSNDATITSAMIAMAHRLSLEVVAEGVERTDQLRWLREWGCNTIQGFVFSPPLPPEEFTDFVTGGNQVLSTLEGCTAHSS
jgi:diguanylate cyclase (GGDEF)-like protein